MKLKRHVNPAAGSRLEDFLRDEGILEEVEAGATRQILAWEIEEAMNAQGVSRSEMARRMGTSRTIVNRLLDAGHANVTLLTLVRAAEALGKKIFVQLVDAPASASPTHNSKAVAFGKSSARGAGGVTARVAAKVAKKKSSGVVPSTLAMAARGRSSRSARPAPM